MSKRRMVRCLVWLDLETVEKMDRIVELTGTTHNHVARCAVEIALRDSPLTVEARASGTSARMWSDPLPPDEQRRGIATFRDAVYTVDDEPDADTPATDPDPAQNASDAGE